MVLQRGWDNSRDEEYWYDDGLPEEPVYEQPVSGFEQPQLPPDYYDYFSNASPETPRLPPDYYESPVFESPVFEPEPRLMPFSASSLAPVNEPYISDSFYSAGGYTREQEAYLQSLRDAFNDLAGRYPGAALIMPDFMNPSYNQPSEDPNVEVDTWTPHYAPGSEIDKAMASGLTPEQMISNLGYGVVDYGKVATGGTKTNTPGVGYKYLTPGQTYTLIDNRTGLQMGPSASTPEELKALSDLANLKSSSEAQKADWSIVTNYGTDAQKTIASDVKDPDKNLNLLYAALALAGAGLGAWGLGAFSGLGGAAGAAGTAGTAGAAGGGLGGALGGATTAGTLASGLASAAPSLVETALVTAPAVGSGLASTLIPATIAGGGLGAALSNIASQVPTFSPPSFEPTPDFETVTSEGIKPYEVPSYVPPATLASIASQVPTLPEPTPPEPTPDFETVTSEGVKIKPYDIPPYVPPAVLTGIATQVPTLPEPTPPPAEPETITSEGAKPTEPELDLDVDAALGAANAAATSGPGNTPATSPSSPDYLSYLRTALGLASLLSGSGSGSGAGGTAGAVPGGAGVMPSSFSTTKLPTGTDISKWGGGTSAADRAPRDMSGIDWKRYAFGPERSFFKNVPEGFAVGGPTTARRASKNAFAVRGPGDGRSDDIPAVLSDGEYVIDAETVALLGNGSNKAGAAQLDRFRANVRKHKGKELAKGRFSANAKNPQAYMAGGRS